jgi:hypothetical protein
MSNDPEIREQLNRIERCLTGDEKMGQRGLVARVNDHTTRIGRIEKAGIYLAGVGGTLGLLWKIWSEWPHR